MAGNIYYVIHKPMADMEPDEVLDHLYVRSIFNHFHQWAVGAGLNPPPPPAALRTARLGTFPVDVRAMLIQLRAIHKGLHRDPPVHVWDASLTLDKVEEMIGGPGAVCDLCLLPATSDNQLVLDRIVPGAEGGRYTLTPVPNVRPAHRRCNQFRCELPDDEMYEMVRQVVAHQRRELQLDPGTPLTVAAAAAIIRGRLGAPLPEMSWEDQLLELRQQQQQHGNVLPVEDDHRLGTQPIEVYGLCAYLKALTGDHPERLNRARFLWFMQTLTGNCYLCDALSGPPTDEFPDRHWGCKDRIDSNVGYGPHNDLPCCNRCNHSKHTHTLEEHLTIVIAIHLAHFGWV